MLTWWPEGKPLPRDYTLAQVAVRVIHPLRPSAGARARRQRGLVLAELDAHLAMSNVSV